MNNHGALVAYKKILYLSLISPKLHYENFPPWNQNRKPRESWLDMQIAF